jgi:hypothetical protein
MKNNKEKKKNKIQKIIIDLYVKAQFLQPPYKIQLHFFPKLKINRVLVYCCCKETNWEEEKKLRKKGSCNAVAAEPKCMN